MSFYSTAAPLLVVLLLTGVVGQIRALQDLDPAEQRRWAVGFVVVFGIVAASSLVGEFVALRVLARNRADITSRNVVEVSLFVASVSVVVLTLLVVMRQALGGGAVRNTILGIGITTLAIVVVTGGFLIVAPVVTSSITAFRIENCIALGGGRFAGRPTSPSGALVTKDPGFFSTDLIGVLPPDCSASFSRVCAGPLSAIGGAGSYELAAVHGFISTAAVDAKPPPGMSPTNC